MFSTSIISGYLIVICDSPREKVTQVGKINFKIRLPTALTANFVNFPCVFFTHWGAESILEPTIYLKSTTNVRLVAGGAAKSAMSLRERARFTEKYAGKFTGGGSGHTSSCILQPLLSPRFSPLLHLFPLIFCFFELYRQRKTSCEC